MFLALGAIGFKVTSSTQWTRRDMYVAEVDDQVVHQRRQLGRPRQGCQKLPGTPVDSVDATLMNDDAPEESRLGGRKKATAD